MTASAGLSPDLGPSTREQSLERMAADTFDVCVIGGGITGAGVALEAVSRGLSVALLDRGDFGSGTSSRSSKLVHGGLRYLGELDVRLCRDAARERELLIRLAPGLVRPVRFLYPAFRGHRSPAAIRVGLSFYDHLGELRNGARHRRVGDRETEALAPRLRLDRVAGAFTFREAVVDDARLVLAVVRAAYRRGAAVTNYVRAIGADTIRGRLAVLEAIDELSGIHLTIRARCFVNAAGVLAAELAGMASEGELPLLRPSKGVHLVLPAGLLSLATPGLFAAVDGREVFAVPHGPVVVVGTTDTDHDGPPGAPTVESGDVEYLLSAIRGAFEVDTHPKDVLAAWAGLRPLVAGRARRTADLSRRHLVSVSRSGLVIVAGGKLTTFRRMAHDAVDAVCHMLGVASTPAEPVPLGVPDPAGVKRTTRAAAQLGLGPDVADRLLAAYGDRADALLELIAEDRSLSEPLVPGLEPLAAEAVWAVRAEMAVALSDVLDRRLSLALYDPGGGLRSPAARLVSQEIGWSSEQLASQVRSYRDAVTQERGPVACEAMDALSGHGVPA